MQSARPLQSITNINLLQLQELLLSNTLLFPQTRVCYTSVKVKPLEANHLWQHGTEQMLNKLLQRPRPLLIPEGFILLIPINS